MEVQLLTGRYVATCFNDRDSPEWPPHPARLFSALVATAYEHAEITPSARAALGWLEEQGAPEIQASEAEQRAVVTTYVPGNSSGVVAGWGGAEAKLDMARVAFAIASQGGDAKGIRVAQKALSSAERKLNEEMAKATDDDGTGNHETARAMLPERRRRQPRTMPVMTPHESVVRYIWPAAHPSDEIRASLHDLTARLVRLGHSSSLVVCRVLGTDALAETKAVDSRMQHWKPGMHGGLRLRVAGAGQLERLEQAFAKHRGVDPRVLPAVHQTYARADAGAISPAGASVFGDWIVFREVAGEGGRRLGLKLSRTEDITRALRGALLSHAEGVIPPVLSGHDEAGRPIERPHVAYVTLADIGSSYAAGNVLGVAIALPSAIDMEERRAVLRAIGRWEDHGLRLTMGRVGVLALERIDADPRRTLDPGYWRGPARRWGSVTPIALDKNPGNLYSRDPREAAGAARNAEEIVCRACERIGLPAPRWVEIIRRSLFDAAPPARDYMPFPKKSVKGNGFSRVCVHVEMGFDEAVAGPVLIGAGRYFGLGLCRGRE